MGQNKLKMLICMNNTSKCYLWDVSSQFSGKEGHTSPIIFLSSMVWSLHTITKLKASREWKRPLKECVGKCSKWWKSQADWKSAKAKQTYFVVGETKGGLACRKDVNTCASECNSFLLDEGIRTSCGTSTAAVRWDRVPPQEIICWNQNIAIPFI